MGRIRVSAGTDLLSIMTGLGQRRTAYGLHEGPRTIRPSRTDTTPAFETQSYCGSHDSISRVTFSTADQAKPLASDLRLVYRMKGPSRQRLQSRCKWPHGNANMGSATAVTQGFFIGTPGNEFGRRHPWYRPRGKTSSPNITRDEGSVCRSTSVDQMNT